MLTKQSNTAGRVAERNQVFAQQPQPYWIAVWIG
jgi:hypothetical protein